MAHQISERELRSLRREIEKERERARSAEMELIREQELRIREAAHRDGVSDKAAAAAAKPDETTIRANEENRRGVAH